MELINECFLVEVRLKLNNGYVLMT